MNRGKSLFLSMVITGMLIGMCWLIVSCSHTTTTESTRNRSIVYVTREPVPTPDITGIQVVSLSGDRFPFTYGIRWGSSSAYVYAALLQYDKWSSVGISNTNGYHNVEYYIYESYTIPYTSSGTFHCTAEIRYCFVDDKLSSIDITTGKLEGWQTRNSAVRYFYDKFVKNAPCPVSASKHEYSNDWTHEVYYSIYPKD